MVVVILSNLVKAVTMGLVVWKHRTTTLVTLGDAVSSFLEVPDTFTEGMCLVTKSDILDRGWGQDGIPKAYKPVQNFWFKSASWKRLVRENTYPRHRWSVTIILAGVLFRIGLDSLPFDRDQSFRNIASLGLGNVNILSLVQLRWMHFRGPWLLLANVLLVNLAQGILSFLYLTYNGLFTCMLSNLEWSRFAHKQKPLRVTSPSGNQRSTYYLQLPYRYSLPLLAVSGTLHWLVSQSIFLARITFYRRDGTEHPEGSTSTCGFFSLAIIFAIITGSVAVLGAIGMGFRRYPAGIPLAGGCSAVISAACHPPPNEGSVERTVK
ncbi:MAG: hypothetical protein M1813_000394 [Trichoglossum hirsutum]|nr:MAG: hypothetical protein M1813_000394 [Trichoglossum hirsutum]